MELLRASPIVWALHATTSAHNEYKDGHSLRQQHRRTSVGVAFTSSTLSSPLPEGVSKQYAGLRAKERESEEMAREGRQRASSRPSHLTRSRAATSDLDLTPARAYLAGGARSKRGGASSIVMRVDERVTRRPRKGTPSRRHWSSDSTFWACF